MSMSRAEIIEELKEIMLSSDDSDTNKKLVAECSESSELTTYFGLNSIGVLYIVISAEETFGVRFEGVGMADFKTLGDVVDYIETHMGS